MSEETKPPKDPELDAAVLRVPYWRAVGLIAAGVVGALPILLYVAGDRNVRGLSSDDAWLEGSSWRIVEVQRRTLAREGTLHFRNGSIVIDAEGCISRQVPYRLNRSGIELTVPAEAEKYSPCAHPAITQTWPLLASVEGVTRYATGLALTDKNGRDLIRLRR